MHHRNLNLYESIAIDMRSKSTRADILTSIKQVRTNENMKAQEAEAQNNKKPKKEIK